MASLRRAERALLLAAVAVLTLLKLAVAGSAPFLRGDAAGAPPLDRRSAGAEAASASNDRGSTWSDAGGYGDGSAPVGDGDSSPGARPPPLWLAEEDLVLTQWQYEALYGSNRTRHKRKILKTTVPWPDAVMPYVIAPWDFPGGERAIIHQAMEEWEEKTCVRFRPAASADRNRVVIQNGRGCDSQLGTVGGTQLLNLESPGCRFKGLYLHELGHALGLLHEHQLPYRDGVVEILLSNVKSDLRSSFEVYPAADVESFGIPYDLSSIMHYGSTAFAADGKSETIRTKDRTKQSQMVDVYLNELAFNDIKAVSLLYKCNASCSERVICSGQGFVGKNCKCVCPDGTSSCQISPRLPTPTAVPQCVNLAPNSSCETWARSRECAANPLYMSKNCRQACKKCGLVTPPNALPPKRCDNAAGDADCANYARSGECATSAAWMLVNCTAACGACALRSRGECFDAYPDSTQCRAWRNKGACDYYPWWMWANCRQTCDVCASKPTGCFNVLPDADCYAAASMGECTGERTVFMKTNCAKACGKCGSCYNELSNDATCGDLAVRGECTNAYHWMERHCKKACKLCGGPAAVPDGQPRPCVDLNDSCPKWASEGECDKNVGWMIHNCQLSCGRCNCTNLYADQAKCDSWAASGECWVNPTWMIPNCQRSCGACTNIAPAPDKCLNSHTDESKCRQWASNGECEANPRWMIPNCRKACTGCSPPTGTTSTTAKGAATERTMARATASRPASITTATGGRVSTTTAVRSRGGVTDCLDMYEETRCRQWANADQCRINPSFMSKNCARSCGSCTPSGSDMPATVRPTTVSTVSPRSAAATTVPSTLAWTDMGEQCQNLQSDEQCIEWAGLGQCTSNVVWMEYYCAKSCNACNPYCDDAYAEPCIKWSQAGQCQQNALWMKYYCYKSCFCSPSVSTRNRNGAITINVKSTVPSTTAFLQETTRDWIDEDRDICTDTDPKCPAWAMAGQCTAHLEFAKTYCPLSCEICTPDACTDGHVNCPQWAKSGKCDLFRYARKTCQLSCKICSIPDWQP